jgi:NTE family protein
VATDAAQTYDEWKESAQAADSRSGADRWKDIEQTELYDYKIIKRRYDELVDIRASGDPNRLLFYLNEGLHGNMGGMGAPALYSRAKFGTKTLVTDYIDELVGALKDLADFDNNEVTHQQKVAYLRRASICFGRSALMFSGAGSLGAFHIGVAKELTEQDLLPTVISGASAGSVVASIIGTHKKDELRRLFDPNDIGKSFEALDDTQGLPSMSERQIQLADLMDMVEASIPDLTFMEAYEETGRHINITVAPSQLHQRSRMLSALTAPNTCIREAVLASCAIPGVFPAVTLMAKDSQGRRKPYIASRKWVDGSITDDLPARRIARKYAVNHFISSQANPLVLQALQQSEGSSNLWTRLARIQQSAMRDWLRAVYPLAIEQVRNVYPLNTYTRLWFSLMTQEYTADITILPDMPFIDPAMLLARLSVDETAKLVYEGQRATWPKIEMIRNCTKISRTIDETLDDLQGPYASNVWEQAAAEA